MALDIQKTKNLQKLNPWNWFKDEEEQEQGRRRLPSAEEARRRLPDLSSVSRAQSEQLLRLQEDFDRLVRNMATRVNETGWLPWKNNSEESSEMRFKPEVDIREKKNEYIIKVDIPGVKEDDIRLELINGQLVVSGEKTLERETEEEGEYHLVERAYGSFQRTLSLPEDTDEEDIKAEFDNGVIKISLPRKEIAQSKEE